MKTLHMLIGLPRSGKSTLSAELGYPIVELDAIRMAIHGTAYYESAEHLVVSHAMVMVRSLFLAGHDDVILDDMNHTEERRRKWQSTEWAIKYHLIDTSIDECIRRATETGQEYLIPVIKLRACEFEGIGGSQVLLDR